MHKRKMFILKDELIDVKSSLNTPREQLYIEMAFKCLNASIDILEYFGNKKNTEKLLQNIKLESIEQAKTYRFELKKDLIEMKAEFDRQKDEFLVDEKKYMAVCEVVRGLISNLKKTIELVKKMRADLTISEEAVQQNQKRIYDLDEQLEKSIRVMYKLIETYQVGGI